MTANILELASQLLSHAKSGSATWRWFIVRAFLWTSWQRLTMIYFSGILGRYMLVGSKDNDGGSRVLRGTYPSQGLSVHEVSVICASSMKPIYMCGLAFELLRKDPVCMNSDFRMFHQRYSGILRKFPGHRLPKEHISCRSDHLDQCQRFKGLKLDDSSAHDQACSRHCKRLMWDEKSYRSLPGARAVPIT